ncbi:mCG114520 [Mus musculus]|nr:mCG114520 [Mus musculus]
MKEQQLERRCIQAAMTKRNSGNSPEPKLRGQGTEPGTEEPEDTEQDDFRSRSNQARPGDTG